jgi:hypothetical protein
MVNATGRDHMKVGPTLIEDEKGNEGEIGSLKLLSQSQSFMIE